MGFDAFLGNARAVAEVREILASRRVPGAMLFSGPEGVGKKTLALMLAKALNCQGVPKGDDFCGECPRCRKGEEMLTATREDLARRRQAKDSEKRVEGLVYFDLQLIEPITRYILIEQIRQLRRAAYTHPFELSRRVFIMDQAQAIHWQAVDLLLKVLEEPPDTTTLILICPNAYELRPTIRSRCRQIVFQPVEESVISALLAEARVPKARQALAARVVAGSIAKARTFDVDDYLRRRQPWLDFLEVACGKSRGSPAAGDWRVVFDSTRALAANRDEFEQTLRTGYALLRDLSQILVADTDAQMVNVDLQARLRAWASNLGMKGIERLKQGLDEAYRLQTRNVNQQLGLDTLAIDLLGQKPANPLASKF
jgi:DNA polymerase-3 subunit delta'